MKDQEAPMVVRKSVDVNAIGLYPKMSLTGRLSRRFRSVAGKFQRYDVKQR